MGGYGFAHIPLTTGLHKIQVPLWKPAGNVEQELDSYFLGRTPALVNADAIYDSAWRERSRLVTMAAGTIDIELFVITRFSKKHGIDQ